MNFLFFAFGALGSFKYLVCKIWIEVNGNICKMESGGYV